jgi:hypothetical protein
MRQHHLSMLIVSFTAAMAVFFGWPSEPPIGVTTAIGTLSLIVLQLYRPKIIRVRLCCSINPCCIPMCRCKLSAIGENYP